LLSEYLVNDGRRFHLRFLTTFAALRLLSGHQHFLVPLDLYLQYSVLLLHLSYHTHILGLSLLDGFDAALHDDLFSINL
jgi:hypothetical protein